MWAIGSIKEDYLGYVIPGRRIAWPHLQMSCKAAFRIRNYGRVISRRGDPLLSTAEAEPIVMRKRLRASPDRLELARPSNQQLREKMHKKQLQRVLPGGEEAPGGGRPGFKKTAPRSRRGPAVLGGLRTSGGKNRQKFGDNRAYACPDIESRWLKIPASGLDLHLQAVHLLVTFYEIENKPRAQGVGPRISSRAGEPAVRRDSGAPLARNEATSCLRF